jgi:hypothetical protein
MPDIHLPRRDLLLAPLLAALLPTASQASPLDPSETILTLPAGIPWKLRPDYPKDSVTSAPLFGSRTGNGLYYELIKWYPGYMSAPHAYVTDRLCVVVSGTWWVNSGADFDPARCEPVPAGTFSAPVNSVRARDMSDVPGCLFPEVLGGMCHPPQTPRHHLGEDQQSTGGLGGMAHSPQLFLTTAAPHPPHAPPHRPPAPPAQPTAPRRQPPRSIPAQ